jgi:hypothetical protein
LKLLSPSSIALGKTFPYSIYDRGGVLLFCQGSVINMADQVARLVARGAQYNENEAPLSTQAGAQRHALPGQDEQSPFENFNSLILNLKLPRHPKPTLTLAWRNNLSSASATLILLKTIAACARLTGAAGRFGINLASQPARRSS